MDSTAVTPDQPQGSVRYGGNRSVKEAGRKGIDGEDGGYADEDAAEKAVGERTPQMPAVEKTVALLGQRFREILGGS